MSGLPHSHLTPSVGRKHHFEGKNQKKTKAEHPISKKKNHTQTARPAIPLQDSSKRMTLHRHQREPSDAMDPRKPLTCSNENPLHSGRGLDWSRKATPWQLLTGRALSAPTTGENLRLLLCGLSSLLILRLSRLEFPLSSGLGVSPALVGSVHYSPSCASSRGSSDSA